jgi:hypothetical protein
MLEAHFAQLADEPLGCAFTAAPYESPFVRPIRIPIRMDRVPKHAMLEVRTDYR